MEDLEDHAYLISSYLKIKFPSFSLVRGRQWGRRGWEKFNPFIVLIQYERAGNLDTIPRAIVYNLEEGKTVEH